MLAGEQKRERDGWKCANWMKRGLLLLQRKMIQKGKQKKTAKWKKRENKRGVCVKMEAMKDLLHREFGIGEHESFDCF